ncbi:Efem/EfeO family lipoprotein [Mangrovactinospora gilvigrisea]|uniref:Efem/EfeO family lipoprotein n=1 Tax=Mangrovactinospora gilvigrisea TaxID=1428644 RepID=A0A1J7C7E4_9ACTN|nr:EfeM/EfeO family lipoprotein [Mangrovactinospora gilvigrisea]OIV35570.1 Efem/EfeO family lipoprotein [Mangrovactinospora gilvigrisea]
MRPTARWCAAVAATAAAALAAGCSPDRTPAASAGTSVTVNPVGCGRGWAKPHAGAQTFRLRNTDTNSAEAYLMDAQGRVHAEVEGIGPGTTRPMRVTLGAGSYHFRCLPDDGSAVNGPVVKVSGGGTGGPAALPVTEHDLIPPTIAYQKWIGARTGDLVTKTAALKADIDGGDLAAAKRDWLAGHLLYERMGAAYGTFGDADAKINGTAAGLKGGARDPGFTGFHRIEAGLWGGAPAGSLRAPAARLASDAAALRKGWAQARMDPLDLGLRAHEIVENTVQFELTGRTDYGSHSNLATAEANLQGTRVALDFLKPVLADRDPGLAATYTRLAATERLLHGRADVDALTQPQRERVDAAFGDLVERLADVAALCDPRRTV